DYYCYSADSNGNRLF
nr:immunoglobulin light chain junction region [Macaca mulatta]MOX31003.1 immunoglobulin light chain junction region [Macaca mulatta]